jgi:phosphoglucosamine mutase
MPHENLSGSGRSEAVVRCWVCEGCALEQATYSRHMAKRNLFGTDGVRGVVNAQITSKLALSLGAAASVFFNGRSAPAAVRKVAIAWDPRVSSEMLAAALGAGFMETGVSVDYLGVLPTPGLALILARNPQYMAGAMISASHNPAEYNGIKFFGPGGRKLADADEEAIEGNLGLVELGNTTRVHGDEVGRAERVDDSRDQYLTYIRHSNPGLSLEGLRIVVDGAHGATSLTTPALLRQLGADVVEMNTDEDGMLINKDCGSTHPGALSARVLTEKADVGVAHDGDGDRVIMVDRKGRRVSGDIMLYILATGLASESQLTGSTVVGTVLTNLGLEKALEPHGIRLERTSVGDRYILDRLNEGGFVLGGEESGHIINLYQNVTGDGLATTLSVLRYLGTMNRDLSEIVDQVELYPQIAENVRVKDNAVASRPGFLAAVEKARVELGTEARLVVRPSGTEPVVRIFLEGRDTERLMTMAVQLRQVLLSAGQEGGE